MIKLTNCRLAKALHWYPKCVNANRNTYNKKSDELLLQLYNELGKSGASDAQTFETIIEEKHQKEDLMCVGQSLYRDIKGWCRSYITCKQENDYGYDVYEHTKIIEKIGDDALTDRQKLALIRYIKCILAKYNDDGGWLEDEIMKNKLAILKKEAFLKYLLVLSSSNKKNCLLTIFLFFLIELIVLLPAPYSWMEVFEFQKVDYCSVVFIDYITNVLALKIDWIDGPKLVCLNWRGVLLCGMWMVVYIVFVVNILFNNIFSNISSYDEE